MIDKTENNKKDIKNSCYEILPTVYPTDLNECLKIFEKIRYKSYGFGVIFLYYNYSFKHWTMAFRNPANFDNPNIKAESPIEAAHAMFDFLKSRLNTSV